MLTRNVIFFGFMSGLIGAWVGNYMFRPIVASAQQQPSTIELLRAKHIEIVDDTGNRVIDLDSKYGPEIVLSAAPNATPATEMSLNAKVISLKQREGAGASAKWDTTYYGFNSSKLYENFQPLK